jgi:TolB-like protein/class 3 adenylate cyclase/Tfp pilus assembly protein PilF
MLTKSQSRTADSILSAVSGEAPHRTLAAIMFTDMVGYSALAQRDDKLALELLEEHRRLLREIFPTFHGTEIKTIGDGFLVEFHSALEAAQCAIEIQRVLSKRNHDVPLERRVEIKIGIHLGDVVHRSGDVYGDGVNIASRIEPLAGAGGICVSMDVERQIRNTLEARCEKLRPTELKNISISMDLFRIILPWEKRSAVAKKTELLSKPSLRKFLPMVIVLALLFMVSVGWWWSDRARRTSNSPVPTTVSRATAEAPSKSIAVLPFHNLSRDPDNAYFVEGIQDEILTRLSKIADLKVISQTSTQKYNSAPENLRDVARHLGVTHILEGSVQKSNGQVRVNVQLINALTDAHLWADTYDRHLTDIFAVESEIAKSIADALHAKLTGSEQSFIAKAPTANPEAHELYLKGRFFWNRRSGADLRQAIDYFNQAIEKDPSYALAYAGLADSYLLLPIYAGSSTEEVIPPARAAVIKALELDDSLAEAHASRGLLETFELHLEHAIIEYEHAIKLKPNYATAHQWLGLGHSSLGHFDQAIAHFKRAVELDPLSLIINADFSWAYLTARRFDDAEAQARKTIKMDPRFYRAHYYFGAVLQLKGNVPGAIPEFQKSFDLNGDPYSLAMLGQAYARDGQRDEAQKILARLSEEAKSRYVAPYALAVLYVGLGEKEHALDELERAYQEGDTNRLFVIKVDPFLDDLRDHPRFQALLQKVVGAPT